MCSPGSEPLSWNIQIGFQSLLSPVKKMLQHWLFSCPRLSKLRDRLIIQTCLPEARLGIVLGIHTDVREGQGDVDPTLKELTYTNFSISITSIYSG